jgi:hypothetical protein
MGEVNVKFFTTPGDYAAPPYKGGGKGEDVAKRFLPLYKGEWPIPFLPR